MDDAKSFSRHLLNKLTTIPDVALGIYRFFSGERIVDTIGILFLFWILMKVFNLVRKSSITCIALVFALLEWGDWVKGCILQMLHYFFVFEGKERAGDEFISAGNASKSIAAFIGAGKYLIPKPAFPREFDFVGSIGWHIGLVALHKTICDIGDERTAFVLGCSLILIPLVIVWFTRNFFIDDLL